jgi:pimeloyl-ACP methyl ester carboxylesterase
MKTVMSALYTTLFASALALGAASYAVGADAPASANRYAATLVPAEHFEVGGVLVERHGAAPGLKNGGRALILIPGLVSGSWAWQDTIRAFAADHPIYVLTLPGFDGRPPAGDAPFAAARAAVAELIASRHLDKPVIVGHSVGGTLAFAVAEDRPAAVGGVVSIDGLPVMPGTEAMAPADRAATAAKMGASMGQTPPDRFATQQQAYMRTIGVMDMDRADALAKLSARSDPASAGRWVQATIALDLRPALPTITAPVLVLAPYFDLDANQRGITPAMLSEYYGGLVQGTPKVQIVVIAPARHFAMFDQPQAVQDAIRTFLGTL